MRNILLILMVVVFTNFSASSQNIFTKKLVKASEDAQITIEFAEESDKGIIEIIWKGDSTLSPAYDIQLGLLDTVAYSYSLIADLASYSRAFAIDGYDGYFSISSDLILKYGDNYSTIGSYVADTATIAKWRTAWETSVNEDDFTLKPGTYVVFVEGINLSFETTEKYGYAIVEIKDVTLDIPAIKNNEIRMKYLDSKTNSLYIIQDNKKYDVFGRLVGEY